MVVRDSNQLISVVPRTSGLNLDPRIWVEIGRRSHDFRGGSGGFMRFFKSLPSGPNQIEKWIPTKNIGNRFYNI